MKIRRNDSINIATSKFKLFSEVPNEKIDYKKWVDFINSHKDYFIWYEDTLDGINAKKNIEEFSDWVKERVIYSLNNTNAYSTNKIVKNPSDFVVIYSNNDGMLSVSIEKKMSEKIAEILLEMAVYLDAKVIVNGTKELESIEQLE